MLDTIAQHTSADSLSLEPGDTWLTPKGVCQKYPPLTETRLSQDRFYGPKIPYFKFGRSVRYRRSDVEAWISANFVPAKGVSAKGNCNSGVNADPVFATA